MDIAEYYEKFGSRISQASERLFIEEFIYPTIGSKIENIWPQHPFIDRTGKSRRIDFVYHGSKARIALEVNGETYHAEGIIPDEMFDENLFRQNEILRLGYILVRFSYSQLKSPQWRPLVQESLREVFRSHAPELLSEYALKPTGLQQEVLEALDFCRIARSWKKGVVVLPTGTGKTILSALDARRSGRPILFLVHRLDILAQSIEAYKFVWPDMRIGILTGLSKENEKDCDVLFASKDTLRQPSELERFPRDWFNYIVVDEVHHGQSPTYRDILNYFTPQFMVGMTATPDRTDRKDIFELFDYNKVYEIPLHEVIERGFLVPYSYYGLTDDVDYSRIRFENQRYRVDDLERLLIIPERNAAILKEYLDKGQGDKAIGFCVSINHANRMAEFFNANNIPSAAIHSQSPTRDADLAAFRSDKIQVAFTVDLFNEGVDFPNVRVLLFLRPTESKTVFLQQLGRGLRLCTGKDRVRILDFIGNYKRANNVRKYLSKDKRIVGGEGGGQRKIEYIYSTDCEVHFDATVEEILNRQDAEELGITKEDLKDAYFALAETLGRKPSRTDLDSQGKFKSAQYAQIFGSWLAFLRDVGEYTEASYHYPQGTHLGHILSILKTFGNKTRQGTHFDDEYIRLRGGLGEGRISTYRRQVKYKLQAAMELGILTDDRNFPADEAYSLELTPLGRELYTALKPVLDNQRLDFARGDDGIPTTRMEENEATYNASIRDYIRVNPAARQLVYRTFLNMPAVQQMLSFLYHIIRAPQVARTTIYEQFFQSPAVRQYCDQEGIDETTLEASKRRCPFLLNILDACGIIEAEQNQIRVKKLVLSPALVRPYQREERERTLARLEAVFSAWPASQELLNDEDLSIVWELFGSSFLTNDYYLSTIEKTEE